MYDKQIEDSLKILKQAKISLAKGMTKQELRLAEMRFGIKFPSDYREFLSACLPLSDDFTNWRDVSDENVFFIKQKMFDWTIEGVLYTIEKLNGWLPAWGNKPNIQEWALALAKQNIKKHPLFMPICSHRFLSLSPMEAGNPVYSIHDGTDVICYGQDFWDYIKRDFADYEPRDTVDLKSIKEPIPQYNVFVYHSINNFFYQGKISYDEHGKYIL
ncbi:hypothetical protein SAMN04487970_10516 [Paenibacillus tianmuensis]|uniref:SMI1 / KNR4 family (SUKH-1) n=1 Tax=Paenibacillus tianmuensis TaxID=624147 RepID=A0A1G4TFL0_9BACL|nr:SMI1/KNR4 family protein [Paenibacillus tianmuensis]SCW80200.1 hypothetical protein SAMN04487970_10516 [Paenibacillus tianmuensis]